MQFARTFEVFYVNYSIENYGHFRTVVQCPCYLPPTQRIYVQSFPILTSDNAKKILKPNSGDYFATLHFQQDIDRLQSESINI